MAAFTIAVLVKPGTRQRRIEVSEDRLTATIWTPKPPADGQANQDVVDMIADNFGIPKSRITILRGHKGRKKIIKIMA